MNEFYDRKKLAVAVDALASVVAEIVTERMRRLEESMERRIAELPELAENPALNKKEVAKRLGVKVRTVDNWMAKGYLPYLKIGRSVRFRWKEVMSYLETLEIRRFG